MGINYSVAGYFPEKSRWCSIEHIGQGGSTAYIALNNPEEWTLRNIITHLSFFNMLRCSFIAGGRSRQGHVAGGASVTTRPSYPHAADRPVHHDDHHVDRHTSVGFRRSGSVFIHAGHFWLHQ